VQAPTKYQLFINVKAAKAPGLTVLLGRADQGDRIKGCLAANAYSRLWQILLQKSVASFFGR
jgi:hypothetical protein